MPRPPHSTGAKPRSVWLRPIVLVPLGLAIAALAVFAAQWLGARNAVHAERAQLLADVDAELQKQPIDGSELSRLVARLQRLPDHETARDLVMISARIELARDHSDRAAALLVPLASQPGASPAEQRLAAEILLREQAGSGGDRMAATGLLQQAMAFAETAYRDSGDPADLLRAWQAASRLGLKDRVDEFAKQLAAGHAQAAATRLTKLAQNFEPSQGDQVSALLDDFPVVPPELEAMRVLTLLQDNHLDTAVTAGEALLARAPGVVAGRWAVALVFHACALGYAAGSTERQSWLQRRDAQLDWLLEHAGPDDSRREQWSGLRKVR